MATPAQIQGLSREMPIDRRPDTSARDALCRIPLSTTLDYF